MSNLPRDQRPPIPLSQADVLALGVPSHILHALAALQPPLSSVNASHPVTGLFNYHVRATEVRHGTA